MGFPCPHLIFIHNISCVAPLRASTPALCENACSHFLSKQHINPIPFVFSRSLQQAQVILSLALTVLHRKLNAFHALYCLCAIYSFAVPTPLCWGVSRIQQVIFQHDSFSISHYFLFLPFCLLHRGHFLSIQLHEFVKVFRFCKQGVTVSLILAKRFISFYSFRLLHCVGPVFLLFNFCCLRLISQHILFYCSSASKLQTIGMLCYSRVNIIALSVFHRIKCNQEENVNFFRTNDTKRKQKQNSKEILCGNMMIYLYDTHSTFYATCSFFLPFNKRKQRK